ncbi:MAG: LacI family transcriptional regulator [Verrucomicrobia bacterium]|nr:LacI family transcriptional regulator [Verrucomicrobiota bacterium]
MKNKPEQKRLRDVARMLKVSTATVSRALNNRYGIKRETRAKILKKIEALGYRPNLVAKGLRVRKTSTIGVVIPNIEYSFFPELIRGIEAVASRNNYQIILCHSNEDLEKERQEILALLSKRVDGLIVAPVQGRGGMKTYRDALSRETFPLVLVTRYFRAMAHQYVGCDDRHGGYLATKHLVDMGHVRIAHVTGKEDISPYHDRLAGYRDALRKHKLAIETDLVRQTPATFDGGYRTMRELLHLKRPPSAVFAANDLMAVGALRAAEADGLKVPNDVAVVGFDDIFWAPLVKPALTTVCQPKREIGHKAAEMLLRDIARRESERPGRFDPTRLFLEPTLSMRESSQSKPPEQGEK